MYITNISNLKFNIKTYSTSFKKGNVTSSISNANNFDLYDRALSSYNQINFMGKVSISKEELQDYILEHPNENQKEIAEHFSVTGTTVGNLIKKYKIKYKTPHIISSISKEELKNYIEKHPEQNQAAIAQHFNVSVATIIRLIKTYKLKYVPHYQNPAVCKKDLEKYLKKHPTTTLQEIADYFGICTATACTQLKKQELTYQTKLQRSTSVSKEELSDYIKQHPNKNQREIAEHFDVTTQTIRNLFQKFDIEYHPQTKISATKEELEKYIIDHPEESQEEIGKHFNVTSTTIKNLIKRYGIKYPNTLKI